MFRHAPNFRDLGGMPVAGGGRVARGRLYRSGSLSRLDSDEWARLDELGIRLFCDLRSGVERDAHPLQWPGDQPAMLNLTLLPDVRASGEQIFREIVADPTGAAARNILLDNYRRMPAALAAQLSSLIDEIERRRRVPVLVACTAGQDRTGVVCALLLLGLGAGRADVVQDYLRSDVFYDAERIRTTLAQGLRLPAGESPSDAVVDALRVSEEYLNAALYEVESVWGGAKKYLEIAGGLDEARLESLRSIFIES